MLEFLTLATVREERAGNLSGGQKKLLELGRTMMVDARIVFLDEDMPGGATAFMMQHVLETQGGYWHLDSQPRTVTAQPHRPAYGTDGDYYSKPNAEDVFAAIYELMHEACPAGYPALV